MLEKRAGGVPLGTFIRSTLFNGGGKVHADSQRRLAQILAKLGGSGIATNLNEINHLARLGALSLTPEIEAEIHQATADITEIKSLLMQALRIKER